MICFSFSIKFAEKKNDHNILTGIDDLLFSFPNLNYLIENLTSKFAYTAKTCVPSSISTLTANKEKNKTKQKRVSLTSSQGI